MLTFIVMTYTTTSLEGRHFSSSQPPGRHEPEGSAQWEKKKNTGSVSLLWSLLSSVTVSPSLLLSFPPPSSRNASPFPLFLPADRLSAERSLSQSVRPASFASLPPLQVPHFFFAPSLRVCPPIFSRRESDWKKDRIARSFFFSQDSKAPCQASSLGKPAPSSFTRLRGKEKKKNHEKREDHRHE